MIFAGPPLDESALNHREYKKIVFDRQHLQLSIIPSGGVCFCLGEEEIWREDNMCWPKTLISDGDRSDSRKKPEQLLNKF